MNKALLIGHKGYIGSEFNRQLVAKGWTVTWASRGTNLLKIARGKDLIINAAGFSGWANVDDCNDERGKTMRDNVVLATEVNRASQLTGIPFIHVSSGCIFNGPKLDGVRHTGWTEKHKPNFTFDNDLHSFYTGSKHLAELLLEDSISWICRIRMPFNGENHPRNLLYKLRSHSLAMVGKCGNSVSHLGESVRAMIELYERHADYGVYHVVNTGILTPHFIRIMIEEAGIYLKPSLMLEDNFYKPICKERRSNTILSNEKLLKTGVTMSDAATIMKKSCREFSKNCNQYLKI